MLKKTPQPLLSMRRFSQQLHHPLLCFKTWPQRHRKRTLSDHTDSWVWCYGFLLSNISTVFLAGVELVMMKMMYPWHLLPSVLLISSATPLFLIFLDSKLGDWLSCKTSFESFNKNWMSRDQPIDSFKA
jgi:hypothetical protein